MKSIGKYQVIEELGASASGTAYRARDAFRHRELAIKILKSVPNLGAEAKEQFCDYLARCAELTHRQIAKVQDLGEIEEGIFVATEWLSGMDLTRFMQAERDLPLDQKLGVIAQVAEGLAFAHSRGIAHGNLKPSNIFIDTARDASILDFGIAKWLGALIEAGSRPEGMLANYFAPEQVLGQAFDARSDIFTLGLMLYEFASGQYPFSADAGLIPREIVHTEPTPLRQVNGEVPLELEQLVIRTLHKDPEQRLQSAEEFASGLYVVARQLRRAAAPEPSAGPPSTDRVVEQLPPALSPAFAAPQAPVTLQLPALEIPVTPRERPQDAEPEARPWTARSYASAPSTPPIVQAEPQKSALPRPPLPAPPLSSPPEFIPPQSFLKPPPLPPPPIPARSGKLLKGFLIAVAGLVLAVVAVGSFIARQNLRASQSRTRPVAGYSQQPAMPISKPVPVNAPPAAEVHAAKHEEAPHAALVNSEVSPQQILNGRVRTLWESGRYAQALVLVNQILTNDPADEEALSWKKKIREAQAAEAALK